MIRISQPWPTSHTEHLLMETVICICFHKVANDEQHSLNKILQAAFKTKRLSTVDLQCLKIRARYSSRLGRYLRD